CGHAHRHAALFRGLARGDLPGAGLQDLAHDHVVDLFGLHPRPFQRRRDCEAAELRAAEARQRARELPDRRTRRADEARAGHVDLRYPRWAVRSGMTSLWLPIGNLPSAPACVGPERDRGRGLTPTASSVPVSPLTPVVTTFGRSRPRRGYTLGTRRSQ